MLQNCVGGTAWHRIVIVAKRIPAVEINLHHADSDHTAEFGFICLLYVKLALAGTSHTCVRTYVRWNFEMCVR